MHVEAVGGEAGRQTEHATEAVIAAVQLVVTVDHPEETSPVVLCVEFVAKFFQRLVSDVVGVTVSFTLTTAVVPEIEKQNGYYSFFYHINNLCSFCATSRLMKYLPFSKTLFFNIYHNFFITQNNYKNLIDI